MSVLYLFIFIQFYIVEVAVGILCFNCSATHRKWTGCGANFAPTNLAFNNSNRLLVNCTGENAMCFVRSWSTRAHFAWMVQRGCYQVSKNDPLPKSMTIPTRSMTCRHERMADGEYTVCLCQSNWCNCDSDISPTVKQLTVFAIIILYVLLINN